MYYLLTTQIYIYFLDYIIRNAIVIFLNNLKSYLNYILAYLKVNFILNYLNHNNLK